MKVYIVRHGQTTTNVLGFHSLEDDDLTELGIKQANELKEIIKTMSFDKIFCSPLIRTRHTAAIITNNADLCFDERLKERNPGNLGGKSREKEDRNEYWNYYSTVQYGTSENIKEFFKRVYSFLDDLKTKNYNSVLIVAHSGVSKAFSGYFEGLQDGRFLLRGLKNCEIKEYDL